jgi:hypothetical protein
MKPPRTGGVPIDELSIVLTQEGGKKHVSTSFDGRTIGGPWELRITGAEVAEAVASVSRATRQVPNRRPAGSVVLDPIKYVGANLFSSLFEGELGSIYRHRAAAIEARGGAMRICLLLLDDHVADLPWEFLYDSVRNDFIALSTQSPVTRKVSAESRPLPPLTPPLKILVAEAEVYRGMGTEKDYAMIQEVKADAPIVVTRLRNATLQSLYETLHDDQFDVLHVASTGVDREANGVVDQSLALMALGGSDQPEWVTERRFAALVNEVPSLRLVVLNACYTERIARRLAARLPAAVGTRGSIQVEAYIRFAEGFYRALANGYGIDLAVIEGRQRVDQGSPGGREWAMVQCYLQNPDAIVLRAERPAVAAAAATIAPTPAVTAPEDPSAHRAFQIAQRRLTIATDNVRALQERASTAATPFIEKELKEALALVDSLTAQLLTLSR